MTITSLLHHHHVCCDDLFVAAEEAVAGRRWEAAPQALDAFVREIGIHFRSEEEILFPAFEAATGMSMGPTRMMRLEHAQMRELLAQMDATVKVRDAEGFAGAAETLLVLMQQHNIKEENILYPMCDRSLPAADLAAMLRSRLGEPCPA